MKKTIVRILLILMISIAFASAAEAAFHLHRFSAEMVSSVLDTPRRTGRIGKHALHYEFEYEHLFLLLSVDNGSDTFALVAHVLDTQNCLNEEQLKIALDVVDGIHKNYYGEWNNGVPYFN